MVKWFGAKVFSIVDWSRDLSIMVKWFCAKVFSIVDWSRDLSIMMKWFCAKVFSIVDHFTMMDRSRDLSTIEKTFAKGRIMHLQSIFHYGDFINAAIRECPFLNLIFD